MLPSPKEIKKLAAACRAAGITHFKCGDIEFSLDVTPKADKASPAEAKKPYHGEQGEIESDTLTEEQMLMWSVMPIEGVAAGN